MPTLHVDVDPPERCPHAFAGDTSDVVYFLSFADREVEEASDERELARVWQEAAPLAECCRQVVAAPDSGHAQLRELTAGFRALRDRLDELARMAQWAAERGAKVRLTYSL